MYCLFMDSGVEPGVLALIEDDRIRDFLFLPSREASFPLAGFDKLLEAAHLHKDDIDAVAVGIGPGSYTGIRGAVSVCQALSFARHLPLISVPTLFRYLPQKDGIYRVASDARMGGAFCLYAQIRKGRIEPDWQVEKVPIEGLIPRSLEEGSLLMVDRKLKERLASHEAMASLPLLEEVLVSIAPYVFHAFSNKEYQIGTSPEILYLGSPLAQG